MSNLFGRAIKSARDNRIITDTTLAREFEVPWSTIDKWVDGTTLPDNLLRRQVLVYIEKRMSEEQDFAWGRLKQIDSARGAVLDYKESL